MHRTSRLAIALTAVATSLTSCGSGDGAASEAQATTVPGTIMTTQAASTETSTSTGSATSDSSEDARLLLYATVLILEIGTREEQIAFLSGNVSEDDRQSCMNSAGFDYIPEQTPEEEVAADIRFSLSPEDYAAKYGLGITGWDLGVIPPLEPPRNQTALSSMTESERAAYDAALAQCGGLVDPDSQAWSNAVDVAVEQFRPVVEADEAVVGALADWRACLATAGYEFDTPAKMRESFYVRMNGGSGEPLRSIFDDEVRVAIANVPCEAAYTAARRQVISARFGEFKAFFDAALAGGAAPDAQG